jgi:hypothetical protein
MKKNFSLISSIASILILFLTLVISVSYAWYTNNKKTDASGIGSTASDSISILNQGIFKDIVGENPFPENEKKNEVDGVLSGDVIYYSVGIELSKAKNNNSLYDINISVVNIDGGEYFVSPAIRVNEKPNGTLTENTYLYNGVEYSLYVLGDEEYFIFEEDSNEYISNFYTNLTLDERFVLLEDNTWDLRERQSFDKVHIDMNDVYSEIDEEEKELKEDEEEEETPYEGEYSDEEEKEPKDDEEEEEENY